MHGTRSDCISRMRKSPRHQPVMEKHVDCAREAKKLFFMEAVFLFIQRIQESYLHVEWRILLFALSGNLLCKELPLRRSEFRPLLMANASILSLPALSVTQSCLCSVVRCCFSSPQGDFAKIKINEAKHTTSNSSYKDRDLNEIA